ncbi:Gfo/Idh/MocA family oxidoreductase [Pleomorphomonas sp. JP5]|uniref:Gfo/Idh/MocA family oxidoreductase n=1 Tax=Pleomorphomonas sp. JP5 TaxID=2942998 RepID=UPI0020448348|nr:Gfo/Idh/MocA family oxidoreductase [Pleomorphomonas sp. JP5]MCM5557045.1 Gfo/Idh/MocA family oxidoreductase [Pleomorphomonas sp. JP5]
MILNVALAAWGMSGREFHAPLIAAEPRLSLAAILRRSGPDGSEPGGVRCVADFQAILDDPAIDLVVVNTPNETHYPMASAALAAGKHVVLEKPITVTMDDARALAAEAKAAGRLLAVFHNRRLDGDFLTLKRHLDAGDLGDLVELEWHYDRYRAAITHKRWKEDDLPGAGTWFDLGIHLVDGMLTLFGAPDTVAADMDSLRRPNAATDFFDVRFRYPGHRVLLRASTFVREQGPVIVAHGKKGSLVIPHESAQPHDAPPTALLHTERDGRTIRERVPLEPSRHQAFYANVVDAIAGKADLAFGPEPAIAALTLIHKAIEAAGKAALKC